MHREIEQRIFISTDPDANSKVVDYIGKVCTAIVDSYRGVESIALYGSLTRGDACFAKKEDSQLVFSSDLDLLVISWFPYIKMFNRTYPKSIQDLNRHIPVDLNFALKLFLKRRKSLKNDLDLKKTAITLYGTDIDTMLPDIDPAKLPQSEGLRLLFNRVYSLLPHILKPPRLLTNHEKEIVIRRAAKTISDCCQSLLILKGNYNGEIPSSLNTILSNFRQDYRRLYDNLPDFCEKVKWAQQIFEAGISMPITVDGCLQTARSYLLECIKYSLILLYDLPFRDWTQILADYHQKIRAKGPYISNMLHYNVRLFVKLKQCHPPAFKTLYIPACYYWYAAIVFLLLASEELSPNREYYLGRSAHYLGQVYPCPDLPPEKEARFSDRWQDVLKMTAEVATVSLQKVDGS